MAIVHGGLMQECFPKHWRMGTARTKYDKETDEYGKKRGVRVLKEAKRARKKEVPTAYHILSKIQ